jgi:hypothetical protein
MSGKSQRASGKSRSNSARADRLMIRSTRNSWLASSKPSATLLKPVERTATVASSTTTYSANRSTLRRRRLREALGTRRVTPARATMIAAKMPT